MSGAPLEEHLATFPESRRDDLRRLHHMITDAAPELDVTLTPGWISYGAFHYRYESGTEGDSHLISVADRKQHIAVYVNSMEGDEYVPERFADPLGRVKVGRSCVRVTQVDDLDAGVLREVVRAAVAAGGFGATAPG